MEAWSRYPGGLGGDSGAVIAGAVLAVVEKAVTAQGVPRRLPCHAALFRWLTRQPLASMIGQPQAQLCGLAPVEIHKRARQAAGPASVEREPPWCARDDASDPQPPRRHHCPRHRRRVRRPAITVRCSLPYSCVICRAGTPDQDCAWGMSSSTAAAIPTMACAPIRTRCRMLQFIPR